MPEVNEIALDVVKRYYPLIYTEYKGELQTLRIQQCSLNFQPSLIVRSYALRGGAAICVPERERERGEILYSHVKQSGSQFHRSFSRRRLIIKSADMF